MQFKAATDNSQHDVEVVYKISFNFNELLPEQKVYLPQLLTVLNHIIKISLQKHDFK